MAKPPAGGAVRASALKWAGRRSAQQPCGLLARRVAPARGSRAGAAKGRLPAASATRPRPVTGPRLRWRTWPRQNKRECAQGAQGREAPRSGQPCAHEHTSKRPLRALAPCGASMRGRARAVPRPPPQRGVRRPAKAPPGAGRGAAPGHMVGRATDGHAQACPPAGP